MPPSQMTYNELFKRIDEYFLREQALTRVRAFLEGERQVEGWFKGELLLLLKTLRKENCFAIWQSEFRTPEIGNKRIDFFVDLADGQLYLELKAFYQGKQRDTTINLTTCFTALPSDIDKLADLRQGNKFLLIFVTPKPNLEDWKAAMKKFRKKYYFVSEARTRDEYPNELLIAKLHIQISGNGS